MAEQKVLIDNKAVPLSETKTVVSFGSESPLWAKWVFRGTLIVTSAITLVIAGTQLISEANKFEVLLMLKGIDALAYGFSKMFGIVEK
jgi:hypothetical protein